MNATRIGKADLEAYVGDIFARPALRRRWRAGRDFPKAARARLPLRASEETASGLEREFWNHRQKFCLNLRCEFGMALCKETANLV
jgi:hypothetical protein